MIDYEKLAQANEFLNKLQDYYFHVCFRWNGISSITLENTSGECYEMVSVDDLIAQLRQLANPEPKYKGGDTVWLVDCDEICRATVVKVEELEYYFRKCLIDKNGCSTGAQWAVESKLHPTKQALIEAQIKYWREQLSQELEQHISLDCHASFEGHVEGFNEDVTNPDKYCQVSGIKLDKKKCPYDENGCPRCNPCQHEPEMDFGKDDRPRHVKGINPKCRKCGEFYK